MSKSNTKNLLDILDWEDIISDYSPPLSAVSDEAESVTEDDTISVVGGGKIARPRLYDF